MKFEANILFVGVCCKQNMQLNDRKKWNRKHNSVMNNKGKVVSKDLGAVILLGWQNNAVLAVMEELFRIVRKESEDVAMVNYWNICWLLSCKKSAQQLWLIICFLINVTNFLYQYQLF